MHRPSSDELTQGAAALLAGMLVALSMPPWGWWPLAFAGLALWEWLLAGQRPAVRWRRTWLFTVGWLAPSMAWMWFLTAPGYVAAVALFGCYQATAVLAMPGPPHDGWRWLALPCALTAAEALRFCFPFHGAPLASLPMSQVDGPLTELARVGGAILLTFTIAFLGTNLRQVVLALRRPTVGSFLRVGAGTGAVAALVLVGLVAPDGNGTGRSAQVAIVQGGGSQGTRAIYTNPRLVIDRALTESRKVPGPVDLVLWPENIVNVVDFAASRDRKSTRLNSSHSS